MAEATIPGALCGVMEQALIEKGVPPTLAAALAQKACEPAVAKVQQKVRRTGRSVKRGAKATNKKLSEAFKEANRRLRKKNGELRSGKTQTDVAKLAQKLRKSM
jgi:hypothetical protein